MNHQRENLISALLLEKERFDREYVRDPNMSLNAKQEAFKRFLLRIAPTAKRLQFIDDVQAENERRRELLRDHELFLNMQRRKKRGAA